MTKIIYKKVRSAGYNYDFNMKNGFFARWGTTPHDDPEYSPFGPEILDIEISDICNGINGKPCAWCYKSNNKNGTYMPLKMFKEIFNKLPNNLTQIAAGIGDINGNPEMWDIFDYCRNNDINKVIPNVTINGYNLKKSDYENLVKYCGAVAVSRYKPKYICYDAVEKLIKEGMRQTNIHMLLCEETFDDCIDLLIDYKKDKRLKNLNAIVFLLLKPKGDRNRFHVINNINKYRFLIEIALKENIPIGFDSCFAPIFLNCVASKEEIEQFKVIAESCESLLFSMYINVKGFMYPCSFLEGERGFPGINILETKDFLKDIWYNKILIQWREVMNESNMKYGCRFCPHFDLYGCLKNKRKV